jgi:hypothetical protein
MLLLCSKSVTTTSLVPVGESIDDISSVNHHHHRGHHHSHGRNSTHHRHIHDNSISDENQPHIIHSNNNNNNNNNIHIPITDTTSGSHTINSENNYNNQHTSNLPHCVDPSIRLQPCLNNDTYCGDWDLKNRKYIPNNCYYRDFTGEQARKCIGR